MPVFIRYLVCFLFKKEKKTLSIEICAGMFHFYLIYGGDGFYDIAIAFLWGAKIFKFDTTEIH